METEGQEHRITEGKREPQHKKLRGREGMKDSRGYCC